MAQAISPDLDATLTPASHPRKRRRLPAPLRSPLTMAGLVIITVFVILALLAPLLAPYEPQQQKLSQRLKPPTTEHFLGTDQLGRDMWSRLLWGARISLTIGLVVVLAAGIFGTTLGLISGYAGGIVDEALMRLTDIFFSFPALILAMAIAGALGPNLVNTMIAIAVVTWPVYARLARAQVLSLREREFIQAAIAIGVPTPRVLWRHLLPNSLAPLLVQASFDMGAAILAAAGLSFIGFGAQPPTPEWGVMISEGRKYVGTQPWLSLFPALAILMTVAAFNLIGDGLRDALDPRLRSEL
ncbi:ABC transporter permease [Anaerolineae bacterium CFX7]|nr:ABC transporter permease [Anaerolineae bacterium CFX7]